MYVFELADGSNWKLEIKLVDSPKERFHGKLRISKTYYDENGKLLVEIVPSVRGTVEVFLKGLELDSQHKSAPDFHIALKMIAKRQEEIDRGRKVEMYTIDEIMEIIIYNKPKF